MKDNKMINKDYITDQEFDIIAKYIMLRMSKKISQRKVAAKTGMAHSTIARVETNVNTASLSTFLKMVDAIDCHLEIKENK